MKTLKSVLFAAALSTTGVASAGIPVADGLHLAQTIAVSMAEQMMHEALAQASDQLSEKLAQEGFDLDRELQKQAEDFAWEMYEETTQKYGYGWNFEIGSAEFYKHMETYTNEAARNKDAATMEESLAKYKSKVNDDYRKANGMQSEQAHIQKVMDKDLNWKVMVDSTLAEVNERHKTIEDLRAKADAAKTAQEKTDLQIAIGIEQNAINNEMMRMQLATEAQALENKTERHRLNKDVREEFDKLSFKLN
jgi:hypothetical protein